LSYSFREALRNVVEHSNSDELKFCGQYWPGKKIAKISIIDTGMGVYKGLSSNSSLVMKDNADALHLAILPGISGKALKGSSSIDPNNPWSNSGYGLYMTSKICGNGGSFSIISGDKGLTIDSLGEKIYDAKLNGTILNLKFDISNLDTIKNDMNEYRTDGYEIEKQIFKKIKDTNISASMMLPSKLKTDK
jgi:hypothetical protein